MKFFVAFTLLITISKGLSESTQTESIADIPVEPAVIAAETKSIESSIGEIQPIVDPIIVPEVLPVEVPIPEKVVEVPVPVDVVPVAVEKPADRPAAIGDDGINVIKESDDGFKETDPTLVFSETINSATKLLYDLDAHVQQLVPIEEIGGRDTFTTTTQESATGPVIYAAVNSELELALSKQGESVGALVTQLDTLQKRIQDTVSELTTRRRYILSAMLRPMLNSVRRIRSNVVRIQTQLTSIQSAASSVGTGGSRPAQTLGAADQTAIDSIRKRVDDIQKRIGDIIGRISSSLNIPGTGPAAANSQQPPHPVAGR